MKKQRLDKFIANQLNLSRSVVRIGIHRGQATVNGTVHRDIAFAIDAESDEILYSGEKSAIKNMYIYFLINPQAFCRRQPINLVKRW